MSQKHEALLQMFGEKAEETEELRMDIEDLKTMYRQQVSVCLKSLLIASTVSTGFPINHAK